MIVAARLTGVATNTTKRTGTIFAASVDSMPVLEELLTSIPYGWWVYDLSQDYAHMLWRCQLVGKVSGKTECVYQGEFDTPSEAVQAAVARLHERFGLEA